MLKVYFSFLFSIIFLSSSAFANGLVIHAAEIGVAKFHRYDHKVHPHARDNVWGLYKLPEGVSDRTPFVETNSDGSISIVFSNLEELLNTATAEALKQGRRISVLNITGHGLPGGMWFPKNAKERDSSACGDWRNSAYGEDQVNYNNYYRAVAYDEIMSLRAISKYARASYPCVTGLTEWEQVVASVAKVRDALADDAQIHFLSCLVGLGNAGAVLTTGVGHLLLQGKNPAVMASLNFGLGDWSMPEGMGFWDFINRDQLDRDMKIYVTNKRDRDVMQKGSVRVSTTINGAWVTGFAENRDFLYTHWINPVFDRGERNGFAEEPLLLEEFPVHVRIPGTNVYVQRAN